MEAGRVAMVKRIAITLIVGLCIVAGAGFAISSVVPNLFYGDDIVDGVRVQGLDVGGLSRSEALRKLAFFAEKCMTYPIQIRLDDEAWQVVPADVGTFIDAESALSAAHAVGRTGALMPRYAQLRAAKRGEIDIPLVVSADQQQLMDLVFSVASTVNRDPVDARFVISEDDQITIEPSADGRGLIVNRLVALFREATMNPTAREIELPVQVTHPGVSTAELEGMGLRRLIGEYTTKFNASNRKRTANVRLGALKIDGLMVAPGDLFSFNDVVGPRTIDRGFLEADVIVNSELVPGVGGGICQVSTTLYNAWLLSMLEVVSRMNHSLPVSYVPLGRDATVSYGAIDLQLRNNMPTHILIKASTDKDTITVKVFGDMPDNIRVGIETQVIERIEPNQIQRVDPSAQPGSATVTEKGKPGYRVAVYRVIKEDGTEITRELVSKDRYKPQPSVLTIGSGEQLTAGDVPHS